MTTLPPNPLSSTGTRFYLSLLYYKNNASERNEALHSELRTQKHEYYQENGEWNWKMILQLGELEDILQIVLVRLGNCLYGLFIIILSND